MRPSAVAATTAVMDPTEKISTTHYSSSSTDAVSFTKTHSENVPNKGFGNDT